MADTLDLATLKDRLHLLFPNLYPEAATTPREE